jgi:hypothetical protein
MATTKTKTTLGFKTPPHVPSPTCYGKPFQRSEMKTGYRVLAKVKSSGG